MCTTRQLSFQQDVILPSLLQIRETPAPNSSTLQKERMALLSLTSEESNHIYWIQGWFEEHGNNIQDIKQILRDNVFWLEHVKFEMLMGQVSVQIVINMVLEFRRKIRARYTDRRAIHI